MKHIITIGLCFWGLTAFSQTTKELYEQEKYKDIVSAAGDDSNLSMEDLYYVGLSYFKLEKDSKAIEYYDKAIAKGLNTSDVYYYKGLSSRWTGKNLEAIQLYNKALSLDPDNQTYLSEKALAFYYNKNMDSAYSCAQAAVKLPYKLGTAYYLIPHIQHIRKDYSTALNGFYGALEKVDPKDEYYLKILMNIGQLEYTHTKNYEKSAKAYAEFISLNPKNYDMFPKLIKAYNGYSNYSAGDSLFALMKNAYDNNELSKDYMEYGSVAIDEFKWNGQQVNTYKYFKTPEKPLDIMYKLYLLTPAGDKVERTLLTEQTIQIGDGPKHLLCETERGGIHHTYPYGWKSDDLDYGDLKKAAIMVFEGKMKPQASSNFGTGKKKKKKKK